jgi:murein DD-endopeptidase MepM/ murein hydrolase activator NlpD
MGLTNDATRAEFGRLRAVRSEKATMRQHSPMKSDRWGWAGAATVAFVTLGASARPLAAAAESRLSAKAAAVEAPRDLVSGSCPRGTAPDNGVCVHWIDADDGPIAEARQNAHRDRQGRWSTYEQIPRLPDRPADYDSYRYPVPPGLSGGRHVVSGYDLDQPDDKQRRGPRLKHVGHGAVDLPQTLGTPVRMITLDHQDGDAEVLYVGPLFGTTLLTRHTLREGGVTRDYVMLLGHLASVEPGVHVGTIVKDGDVVAAVGDTGSPSLVHLHLEVRRVREGIDLTHVPAGAAMISDAVSVVCDPRNVLPLR